MTDTESQFGLFSEIGDKAIYEQPINERIRSFLRLEYLFNAVDSVLEKPSEMESRQCICSLIEVSELVSRTDLKSELVKELSKQITTLKAFKKYPEVDTEVLDQMLDKLNKTQFKLKNPAYHPGQTLRCDELISAIKQRLSIAGGTCSFDLPAYHYWLNKSSTERKHQLKQWKEDLVLMQEGTQRVLETLRTSATSSESIAEKGFFQHNMDTAKPSQLVRILLPLDMPYFPEISGGKHRFSIRFMQQTNTAERSKQVDQDVEFELQCCTL